MKKKLTTFILLAAMALTFLATDTYAQSWSNVGSTGFSTGAVSSMSLAINSTGAPYVAYKDTASPYSVTVQKFNGTSWGNVGAPAFSGGAVDYATIAVNSSSTPYVAYQDHNAAFRASVKKFNGVSWVAVGATGFSGGGASFTSIAIDAGGTPYVAFEDSANSSKVTVMKFNGTSWVTVGAPGFSAGAAESVSIALNGSGTPYVTYVDFANSQKVTVMRFNGTSWVPVGVPGFSTGQVATPSIAIDRSGVAYVAYQDFAYSLGATVMKYNGTTWVPVGAQGFSAGVATFTSLALNWAGTPYVVYSDFSTPFSSSKATVMAYNGSSWVIVGSAEFSGAAAASTVIAIGPSGTPYVAYQDAAAGEKATSMKYTQAVPGITGTATVCVSAATTLHNTDTVGFWNSSNSAVATVGAHTGMVSGISAGTAIIYYTAYDNTVTKVVTVNPLPNAGTISGASIACLGYNSNFSDAIAGGVWSSSDTSVATISVTGTATALNPGTTTISYSLTNSCGTRIATHPFAVDYSPVVFPITGQTTVCAGSLIQLHDGVPGGVWTVSNSRASVLSLSGNGYVTGVSAGTAIVSYRIATACKDTFTTYNITIDTVPQPLITLSGRTYTSVYEFPSYEWLDNGSAVLGATYRSFYADSPGVYSLRVTDANGCSAISPSDNKLEVSNVSQDNIRIYPNPTQNTLFITASGAIDAAIATIDGRAVLTVKETKEINLGTLPNDLYIITVYDHDTGTILKTEKILKAGKQ